MEKSEMSSNSLDIYVGSRLTATLKRDPARGDYTFSYLPGATDPVSLTMPVCDTTDVFMSVPPVFETSLPEGELLETIFRKIGKVVKLSDDFDILGLVGRNLIGRLSVIHSGEDLSSRDSFTNSDRLERLLRSKNSKDLVTQAMTELAERTGVSGVLPKTFAISDGKVRLSIPTGDYILKSESHEYPGICLVEHACMIACKNAGLVVPETILSEDGRSLLVRRFDVSPDGSRYGFEDFCSLSFIGRKGKYDSSYEATAKIVTLFSTDIEKDMRTLFRSFVMMNLLQNGDAHLKNFGFLYSSSKDVRLSPVYDVVTTTSFIPKDLPALTFEGKRKWNTLKEISRFGIDRCGLGEAETKLIIKECVSGIGETIPFLKTLRDLHPIEPVRQTLSTFEDASNTNMGEIRKRTTVNNPALKGGSFP